MTITIHIPCISAVRAEPVEQLGIMHSILRLTTAITMVAALSAPLTALATEDLLQVYEAARQADPDLLSVEAAAGAAAARDQAARGQILPQLSATASLSKVKQEQDFDEDALPAGFNNSQSDEKEDYEDNQALRLILKQPLFNWAAFQAKKATRKRRDQAQQELEFRRSELMVEVASRYFDVVTAEADVEAARLRSQAVDVQLKRARASFESGLAPITDLQQAESQLDAVLVDAIAAENTRANNLDLLTRLTGKPHNDLATARPPYVVEAPKGSTAEDWVKKALTSNPAYAARKLALDAAGHDIQTKRGAHYPTLDFTASLGETEQPVDFGFGNTQLVTDTSSYGLELNIPIFSGGTTSAQVREAEFVKLQSQQALVRSKRQIESETRTAYRNVTSSAARVNALRKAIKSGETAVKAAKAGLASGTRNILDVLEAELDLIQRQTDLKRAWYEHARSGLLLKHLAGELSAADLGRANAWLQSSK